MCKVTQRKSCVCSVINKKFLAPAYARTHYQFISHQGWHTLLNGPANAEGQNGCNLTMRSSMLNVMGF